MVIYQRRGYGGARGTFFPFPFIFCIGGKMTDEAGEDEQFSAMNCTPF